MRRPTSLPTSLPSAAEASSSVLFTAGWSPQASSMPTVCDPCPGKTNANSAISGLSPADRSLCSDADSEVEQHGAPGEAAAHAFEHHRIAAFDAAVLHRHVQGQRHRRGRGIPVFVYRYDQLFE